MKINTDKLSGNTEGCKNQCFLTSANFNRELFLNKDF